MDGTLSGGGDGREREQPDEGYSEIGKWSLWDRGPGGDRGAGRALGRGK